MVRPNYKMAFLGFVVVAMMAVGVVPVCASAVWASGFCFSFFLWVWVWVWDATSRALSIGERWLSDRKLAQ